MATEDNMPPGVSPHDIPGNTVQDNLWEKFHAGIGEDCEKHGLSDVDAFITWNLGLKAYQFIRAHGAAFPHDPDKLVVEITG